MKSNKSAENPNLHLQSRGIHVTINKIGAALSSVCAPDRNGQFKNIAFFHSDSSVYAGAIIAPIAGRIRRGEVAIHNQIYQMPCNEGANCLHSGTKTLAHTLWDVTDSDSNHAALQATLLDGDCGLPGNRTFTVSYTLEKNSLCIELCVETHADTFVNPTSHAYWNLSGDFSQTAYDHELTIPANDVWLNDEHHLPTLCKSVQNTTFDFRTPKTLANAMHENWESLDLAHGYNNAYVLNGSPAAVLTHAASGRQLTIETDAPCLVFYSGGFLDMSAPLPDGTPVIAGSALAFEPQLVPDAPYLLGNDLPLLRAGESFHRLIRYRFLTVS